MKMDGVDRAPKLCLVISYSLRTALEDGGKIAPAEMQGGFLLNAVENDGAPFLIAARSTSVTLPHRVDYSGLAQEVRRAGSTHVLSAGVAGALNSEATLPSLAVPDQFIDLHRGAPLDPPESEDALYADFSNPYCSSLRTDVVAYLSERSKWPVWDRGCYVGVDGPRHETEVEARAYRILGGDVVGMTAVREAVAYRYAGLRVATVALITRHAAGMGGKPASGDEIASMGSTVFECGCAVARRLTAY